MLQSSPKVFTFSKCKFKCQSFKRDQKLHKSAHRKTLFTEMPKNIFSSIPIKFFFFSDHISRLMPQAVYNWKTWKSSISHTWVYRQLSILGRQGCFCICPQSDAASLGFNKLPLCQASSKYNQTFSFPYITLQCGHQAKMNCYFTISPHIPIWYYLALKKKDVSEPVSV